MYYSDTSAISANTEKSLLKGIASLKESRKISSAILMNAWEMGYVAANIDSVVVDSLKKNIYLSLGSVYKWSKCSIDSNTQSLMLAAGLNLIRDDQVFNLLGWSNLCRSALVFLEDNGYPFASVGLERVKVSENTVEGFLRIEKGPMYLIDSLVVKGDLKMSKQVVARIANIREGMIYNESAIREIPELFQSSPLCRLTEPPKVEFFEKYSRLILNVKSQKSSYVDGTLGLVPGNGGRVQFNGDLTLKLKNVLRYAEEFNFKWKKSGLLSQELKAFMAFPYIFRSSFGVSGDLMIYKKDSSYLNVGQKGAVLYSFGRGNRLNVSIESRESSVLSDRMIVDLSMIDSRLLLYSSGLSFTRLNNPVVPTKGYSGEFSLGAGKRTFKKKLGVDAQYYDTIPLSTRRIESSLTINGYFKLRKRLVLNSGLIANVLIDNNLYVNDALRFGGLKSMRGFDEESILASKYAVLRNEFRFMLDKSSYLFALGDLGAYESSFWGYKKQNRFLFGIGAGLAFETPAGLFSITYALGRDNENPFVMKNGKVHFGIVNNF